MTIVDNLIITVIAYTIDRIFGEFGWRKHPIVFIGDIIAFFEKLLYKPSVFRGGVLVVSVLGVVGLVVYLLEEYMSFTLPHPLALFLSGIIASVFLAHNMLRQEVQKVVSAPTLQEKKEQIATLVSRDTDAMDESDVYKAAVETYAENLSDGVIAPLFYLLCFGLYGIILYKTINTMDSMIGYKNSRYEKFGKVAAKLDDLVNLIPARVTAFLIMLLSRKTPLTAFYQDGKRHESPNAGLPITAMALALGIKLGGPTSYFGELKNKPFFGDGREEITKEDVQAALDLL